MRNTKSLLITAVALMTATFWAGMHTGSHRERVNLEKHATPISWESGEPTGWLVTDNIRTKSALYAKTQHLSMEDRLIQLFVLDNPTLCRGCVGMWEQSGSQNNGSLPIIRRVYTQGGLSYLVVAGSMRVLEDQAVYEPTWAVYLGNRHGSLSRLGADGTVHRRIDYDSWTSDQDPDSANQIREGLLEALLQTSQQ